MATSRAAARRAGAPHRRGARVCACQAADDRPPPGRDDRRVRLHVATRSLECAGGPVRHRADRRDRLRNRTARPDPAPLRERQRPADPQQRSRPRGAAGRGSAGPRPSRKVAAPPDATVLAQLEERSGQARRSRGVARPARSRARGTGRRARPAAGTGRAARPSRAQGTVRAVRRAGPERRAERPRPRQTTVGSTSRSARLAAAEQHLVEQRSASWRC